MPNPTHEHPLLAASAMNGLERLHEHVQGYERSVAAFEYEPTKSPRPMEPLLLSGAFDPTLFDDRLLFSLFEDMSVDPERTIGGKFRVYIEGMLSPQAENDVLYTRPLPGERFENYVRRAIGGRKFGVIVNGAEQWSDTLARLATRVFAPVLEAQGVCRSQIEVTLFIGDYGFTPFGIHIDDPFTSVVHFHAGPANKRMTMFGIDQFHELNGPRKNCFEPEKLIPHGRTYIIRAGDVFLLPAHFYHIGCTERFSVAVAFALSKYPRTISSRHVLQRALEEDDMDGTIEDLVGRAAHSGETLADWLRTAEGKFDARADSRRRLRYSFQPAAKQPAGPHELWSRDPDFPLTSIESNNHLLVYARGNLLRLSRTDLTRKLMVSLPYSAFCVESWHQELRGAVSIDAVSALVSQLARVGGLRRVPLTT